MSLLKPFIFFVALVWDRSSDGVEQFDYYTVAYQWPRTFQEINNLPNNVNYWTIHGFWPSRKNGFHPRNCNNIQFDLDIIPQNVKQRMDIMWPNLGHGDNQQFWKYQWRTHGTCSGMNVEVYFTTAIELSDRYNLMQDLWDKNIKPGYPYHRDGIRGTIRHITGHWPIVTKPHDFDLLFEIHICFNRNNNNVMDCPENLQAVMYNLYYPPLEGAPAPAPLQLQQQMLNGQNSISFSYSFVILSVILSNI